MIFGSPAFRRVVERRRLAESVAARHARHAPGNDRRGLGKCLSDGILCAILLT